MLAFRLNLGPVFFNWRDKNGRLQTRRRFNIKRGKSGIRNHVYVIRVEERQKGEIMSVSKATRLLGSVLTAN